jgi:2-polyprenyl-3-methyl-5-hydroxy-6-metoxy-1,4-benzoquinol methylase
MNQVLQKMYETHHAERNRLGFTILEDKRGEVFAKHIGTGKKIMDIGCRDGSLTKFFSAENTVLGVDIDKNALSKLEKDLGIRTMFFDLNDEWSELGGEKFDVITAGEIVEHLFYPERVFDRVLKHLNSGGLFIGSVPNAFTLKHRLRYLKGSKRYTPLSDPTHINHFSVNELETLLKKKFKKVEIVGLGKHSKLAELSPSLFAFDLVFIAEAA